MRLDPHPQSFIDGEEREFVSWAQSVARPKAMDLFCGAGGLSLGLHSAGFEVVVGVDHDRQALETHRANFPGFSVDWDLSDEDAIESVVGLGRSAGVDLVVGGPPCQPFSKAGRSMIRGLVRSGRRSAKDQRRDLWESFVAVVDGVRPSAVLMENVPDMALDRDMQILRTMVDLLESMDYSVSVRVLDASRFEVPQFRQRLILVALASRRAFEWPDESGYQVTLRTAIGDLPKVEGGGCGTRHGVQRPTEDQEVIFRRGRGRGSPRSIEPESSTTSPVRSGRMTRSSSRLWTPRRGTQKLTPRSPL